MRRNTWFIWRYFKKTINDIENQESKQLITEFIKDILVVVDHFKENNGQVQHLKKITEAQNKIEDLNRKMEELNVKLTEKDMFIHVHENHSLELQNLIENMNRKISDLKDETILQTQMYKLEFDRFKETEKIDRKMEAAFLKDKITELKYEKNATKIQLNSAKEKESKLELEIHQLKNGNLKRQYSQNPIPRFAK